MKSLISRLGIAVVLVFSTKSLLGASNYLQEIKTLYESGRAPEAYTLATQYLLEAEGDPAFDYYYGLAAIDSGYISHGVFALERVLLINPGDHRVRLELARGYFLLEQYDRARREFNNVLNVNPPEDVQVNIRHFLNIIRQRESRYKTTATLFVELGAGYDTNVNGAPSAANFDTPLLGPGTLDNASIAKEDSYISYAAGANVAHPVAPGLSLFGSLSASQRNNDDVTSFNLRSINTEAGLTYLHEQDRYQIRIQWQDYEIGHDRYREMLGAGVDWRRNLDHRTQLTAFARYADMDFLGNRLRDSIQGMGGIGLSRAFFWRFRPIFYATLYGGKERAHQDSAAARSLVDRDIYGLNLGSQLMLNEKLSTDIAIEWQESRYSEEDDFFLLKREDEYHSIALGVTWLTHQQCSVRAKLAYTENRSNISINRFHRFQAGLTLRYEY